jgi:hypothetical protein
MPVWLLLLEACWVATFVGLGCKLWLLGIDMLDNLAPGAPSEWKFMLFRRTPSPEELNEMGQIFRRQYLRLALIMGVHMISGGIVFNLWRVAA